jgi:hypothetical protein
MQAPTQHAAAVHNTLPAQITLTVTPIDNGFTTSLAFSTHHLAEFKMGLLPAC